MNKPLLPAYADLFHALRKDQVALAQKITSIVKVFLTLLILLIVFTGAAACFEMPRDLFAGAMSAAMVLVFGWALNALPTDVRELITEVVPGPEEAGPPEE